MSKEATPFRPAPTSYSESLDRWTTPHAASDYPSKYGQSLRDRRELGCIRRFVESLAPNSRILDLPCGTGRLTPLLLSRGLQVVGADGSEWMVNAAREQQHAHGDGVSAHSANPVFEVREALNTGYPKGAFDAIVCNRLFHHFREPETRTAVLKEFGRICRGPILVSFFNSFALDAFRVRMKHWIRGKVATDRIPISLSTMRRDVGNAGMDVVAKLSVLWGLSPMCYLVLQNRVPVVGEGSQSQARPSALSKAS
ncbi:MAG: methyltransferase domain-containing protein [Planctomycetaceae bacterium]|nr:methyltransferase domain-containing protein [Planctomycetaceae bacterium]